MKLDELSTITGATIRQIRFLISEGFVPYPRGTHLRYIWGPTRPGDPALPAAEGLGFPNAAIRLLLDAREACRCR
jgi:hypothetical protein